METTKKHPLISVTRLWSDGGAIIERVGKTERPISERLARRIDASLHDELKYRSFSIFGGRCFMPLTDYQIKRKLAELKRSAIKRTRRDLGITMYRGWTGNLQRR